VDISLNKTTLGAVAAIIISIGVIWTGTVTALDAFEKYHDDRWITIAGLEKIFSDRDLKALKKQIKEYEWLKNNGGLTDKQQWELGEMYDDLEDAQ